MRLLLILTEFPPSIGGMQTHAVYLARFLVERGHTVEVATYRGDAAGDASLPYPVRRCLNRIGHWTNLKALEKLARRFQPDLIYASTVFFGHLRRLTGVPVVCRSAGNDILRPWIVWPYPLLSGALSHPLVERPLYDRFRRWPHPEQFDRLLLKSRIAVMRQSVSYVSRILANSEFTAGLLDELGVEPARVRVLPGGVDAARFSPPLDGRADRRRRLGLPERAYLVSTACRLVPKKGLDLLLPAFTRLRKRVKEARLVVSGGGGERDKCERLAASLGVAGKVIFTGEIPHERIREYYWCADQFVLASREYVNPRNGVRDVETMGRVLCEANASGVPVAAARSGGIPSVIRDGDNGLLFAENDERACAEAMLRLREDGALAEGLRQRGFLRARAEFDWPILGAAHEAEFAAAMRAL